MTLFDVLITHVTANDGSKLTRSYETNIFGPNTGNIKIRNLDSK
jgi:hypothetical protein